MEMYKTEKFSLALGYRIWKMQYIFQKEQKLSLKITRLKSVHVLWRCSLSMKVFYFPYHRYLKKKKEKKSEKLIWGFLWLDFSNETEGKNIYFFHLHFFCYSQFM